LYNKKNVEDWFEKYRAILDKYRIKKGKNIYNIDKSGTRVGCPTREKVIVLIKVKELYTSSPENSKSVIIIKAICTDSSKLLPLLVICLRKYIIEL
jgi:hypothetical protein